MRTATLVLSALMSVSLAACGEEEDMPETGAEARERLSVVFDNQRELATIRLLDGTAVDLRQEPAADGFWYRSDQHELRGVGRDATWKGPMRDETTCQALS